MLIVGIAVATFNNKVPVTLHGEGNVDVAVPVFRSWGQGNGKPGSGYNGSALGSKKSATGSFKFVVDATGQLIEETIQTGLLSLFTINWPIGDPALGASKGQAIDAHFDRLSFANNAPEGQYIITGTMSAGDVKGPAFEVPG
jgi:hypothetical protein